VVSSAKSPSRDRPAARSTAGGPARAFSLGPGATGRIRVRVPSDVARRVRSGRRVSDLLVVRVGLESTMREVKLLRG